MEGELEHINLHRTALQTRGSEAETRTRVGARVRAAGWCNAVLGAPGGESQADLTLKRFDSEHFAETEILNKSKVRRSTSKRIKTC